MKRSIQALLFGLLLLTPLAGAAKTHQVVTRTAKAKKNVVVDVYYFHGHVRCMSCNKIEAYTKEVVEKRFADAVKKGRVKMHVLDLEDAENAHYIDDFKINAKSVVVTRSVGGKAQSYRALDQVWPLLRDKARFQDYIAKNIAAAELRP